MLVTTTLQVDSKVPFGDSIYAWLNVTQSHTLAEFAALSRLYEPMYMAWEEVRLGRNPFFENGTGLEGYFVGVCHAPEETLERLLGIGRDVLNNIARMHRHDPHFHNVLIQALFEECDDPLAIAEWSTELGATLGRLRCYLLNNAEGSAFQAETYTILHSLPPIEYAMTDNTIRQHYHLLQDHAPHNRITVDTHALTPEDQEAWQVVRHIGRFGHPFMRTLLTLTTH
jgi:hypothetical protein